jgi:hypothetical protein
MLTARSAALVVAATLLMAGQSGAQQSSALGGGQTPAPGSLLLPASPVVRSLYLDATPTAAMAVVAGKAFPLVVDVSPKKGIHVYAPGNKDYTPIGLAIDTQPGLTVAPAAKYPKAEAYFFAPLKETVHVYQAPFRLTRNVTLAANAARTGASVTIRGRLEYQACDDKVCYLPQSVPLTWTVAITR